MVAPVVPYVVRSRKGEPITVDPRVGYIRRRDVIHSECAQLVAKVALVFNSVKTFDQHLVATRYANLAIKRIEMLLRDRGFRGVGDSYTYTRAIDDECLNKLKELVREPK